MKRCASFALVFLFAINVFSTKWVFGDPYIALENFFSNFFQTELYQAGYVDNGYYTSQLSLLSKDKKLEHVLHSPLHGESEIKNAIKESLLSQFAYVDLNDLEQEQFAQRIVDHMKAQNFKIFRVNKNYLQPELSISLTSSCSVFTPENVLVFVQNDLFDNHSNNTPMVYVISSDVCD